MGERTDHVLSYKMPNHVTASHKISKTCSVVVLNTAVCAEKPVTIRFYRVLKTEFCNQP